MFGAEWRHGSSPQPEAPTELVIRNQGLWLDHPLLLQFPNQAAVRVILEAKQGVGQVFRWPRAIASTVVKIEPAFVVQGLESLLPAVTG